MDAQEQLKLEFMRARTALVFLLSEQVRTDAEQIRIARRQVSQLVEAIKFAGNQICA